MWPNILQQRALYLTAHTLRSGSELHSIWYKQHPLRNKAINLLRGTVPIQSVFSQCLHMANLILMHIVSGEVIATGLKKHVDGAFLRSFAVFFI